MLSRPCTMKLRMDGAPGFEWPETIRLVAR